MSTQPLGAAPTPAGPRRVGVAPARRGGPLRPAAFVLVASMACLAVVACASGAGPTPPRRYFSLAPQAPDAERVDPRPRVRVREFDCAKAYDSPNVMFRVSPVEIRSYRYNMWASKPGVMVSEVIRRYLAASGRFSVIEEDEIPDVELNGRIDVIEQDTRDRTWQGRLELSLYLERVRDGRIVWRWRIDGTQEAESREVAEVVAAQSRVLTQGLSEALPSLAEAAVEAVMGPPAGTSP